jgi:hypothetical protein
MTHAPAISGLSGRRHPGSAIRRVGWIAAASLLALAALAPSAGPTLAAGEKWFVCKYVGTPGVDEILQTGQNPISVSENAIPLDPVVAGVYFQDSQGRSYVLVEDTGQPEPPASQCPPVTAPTPPPTPTPTPVPAATPTPTPVALQLPNTSTVDTSTSRSDGYLWQIAFAAFGGLLAAALILSPVLPLLVKRIRR